MEILNFIPTLIFGIALIVVFILFVSGSIIFFFSQTKEKGRGMIMKSLIWLFVIVLMFLSFSLISYWVKKGNLFNPQTIGEFPSSPAGGIPPVPVIK
jgi:amino acid permease